MNAVLQKLTEKCTNPIKNYSKPNQKNISSAISPGIRSLAGLRLDTYSYPIPLRSKWNQYPSIFFVELKKKKTKKTNKEMMLWRNCVANQWDNAQDERPNVSTR